MTDTTTNVADEFTAAGHEATGQPNTTHVAGRSRRRGAGRDRRHLTPGRQRQVKIRYTENEYATLSDAARLAGLTPTGYAAEAAMAAACDAAPPSTAPWRLVLAELMAARGQVRRFGSNVNQAARALNALGETPEWLARAVAITERAVNRLDEAATAVTDVASADRKARARQRPADMADAHDSSAGQTSPASRRTAGETRGTTDDARSHTPASRPVVSDQPAVGAPTGGQGAA